MPFKYSILDCKSKYSKDENCTSTNPAKPEERQEWIHAIPYFNQIKVSLTNFRICSKHLPVGSPMKKGKGGFNCPTLPPSVFNRPTSCLPTHKPPTRKAKLEFLHQSYFDKKDKFESFSNFTPEKGILKKYKSTKYFNILVL